MNSCNQEIYLRSHREAQKQLEADSAQITEFREKKSRFPFAPTLDFVFATFDFLSASLPTCVAHTDSPSHIGFQ